jgi:hypothetical protein
MARTVRTMIRSCRCVHTQRIGVIASDSSCQRGGRLMLYILLWLLGVPVTLLIVLFLLGIGR